MKDLKIVIPAYNEESGIGEVIERVKKSCNDAKILVVDDGSRDRTAAIAAGCGAVVINNPTNYGYGKALKVGFDYNLNHGEPINYFAFLDADGTYPPEKIPELYNICKDKQVSVAVGSRFLGRNLGMPKIRMFGNTIFAWLTSLYTGKRVTDTASGLRVFDTSLLPELEKLPDGLNFTPGMTSLALLKGITYSEIPIDYSRRAGNSKLSSLRDGYRFLRAIMNNVRCYRPFLYYATLGIPLILFEFLLRSYISLQGKNAT